MTDLENAGSAEAGDVGGTLNDGRPAPGSEAARRLIEANRDGFDCPHPAPGAVERRVVALETALAAARAEAETLQAQVRAFETSTMWRVTRPVRLALDAIRPPRPPPPAGVAAGVSAAAEMPYQAWIAAEEAACLATLARPGPGAGSIGTQRLGLVLMMPAGQEGGREALAALLADCPAGCTVLVLGDLGPGEDVDDPRVLVQAGALAEPAAAVGVALGRLEADMLCFLDARDRLAPAALGLAAAALAQQPHLDLVFADEDWLDEEGRRVRPFFKPGWDAELQRGRDLVGPFAFFRTALVRAARRVSGPGWLQDLANQVAAATRPDRIHHISAVLCHRVVPSDPAAGAAAAVAALRRDGVPGRVVTVPAGDGPGAWQRVIYDLPSPAPLVSVIVPARDRADLLRVCAEGVLTHTDYPRLELLIVDNGSTEPDALDLMERLAEDGRVRVLRHAGPFNWSALNNAAAAEAVGEVLVLLNNDIAVLRPDWLTVLVSHAVQPGVGAVGAKLLYPDGSVQHAGLTTDPHGVTRHLFRHAAGDAAGAYGLMGVARQVWGVTGACLAIGRDVFFALGGLNEALPVAYNDVDLCLRLTAHGYRVLWTPWAVLEHRELASRPPDHSEARRVQAQEELNRLQRDWGALVRHDPFLNPNLVLVEGQPRLMGRVKAVG